MKKLIAVFISMILFLTACSSITGKGTVLPPDAETSTVIFDSSFRELTNWEPNEIVDYFEKNGKDQYIALDIDANENVIMKISAEQQEYWENFIILLLEEEDEELKNINSKYYSTYSEDYTVLSVYYDLLMDFDEAYILMYNMIVCCGMRQFFDGNGDYTVILNIYNVDTGKLLSGGNVRENGGVGYDGTYWEESYILTSDEASDLVNQIDDAEDIVLRPSVVTLDNISMMHFIVTDAVSSNDYTYLYIDEDGNVHFGLNSSQEQNFTQALGEYLTAVKNQFEDLESGYRIDYNQDYTQINFAFDGSLSDQDQVNYFVYTVTVCTVLQVLNTGSEDYYIDINIYDSSTGELVSNGNTADGISWNWNE